MYRIKNGTQNMSSSLLHIVRPRVLYKNIEYKHLTESGIAAVTISKAFFRLFARPRQAAPPALSLSLSLCVPSGTSCFWRSPQRKNYSGNASAAR